MLRGGRDRRAPASSSFVFSALRYIRPSLRGALATKQSSFALRLLDCFAWLAMTGEISPSGIKFHLRNTLPQAICSDNRSRGHRQTVPENGMPEIKIVTEVAGRVCALPVEVGAKVSDGDDIAFVEAMKMEIPVASPAAGKLKSLLVKIDDVV